jgi:hypothetical protein
MAADVVVTVVYVDMLRGCQWQLGFELLLTTATALEARSLLPWVSGGGGGQAQQFMRRHEMMCTS